MRQPHGYRSFNVLQPREYRVATAKNPLGFTADLTQEWDANVNMKSTATHRDANRQDRQVR